MDEEQHQNCIFVNPIDGCNSFAPGAGRKSRFHSDQLSAPEREQCLTCGKATRYVRMRK